MQKNNQLPAMCYGYLPLLQGKLHASLELCYQMKSETAVYGTITAFKPFKAACYNIYQTILGLIKELESLPFSPADYPHISEVVLKTRFQRYRDSDKPKAAYSYLRLPYISLSEKAIQSAREFIQMHEQSFYKHPPQIYGKLDVNKAIRGEELEETSLTKHSLLLPKPPVGPSGELHKVYVYSHKRKQIKMQNLISSVMTNTQLSEQLLLIMFHYVHRMERGLAADYSEFLTFLLHSRDCAVAIKSILSKMNGFVNELNRQRTVLNFVRLLHEPTLVAKLTKSIQYEHKEGKPITSNNKLRLLKKGKE